VPWVEFRNGQAEKGYPDIEAFDSIKGRVVKFAEKLFELDRSGDGLVVATTHQDTVHAAIAQALGYDELNAAFNPGVKDASITVIFYNKSGGSKLNAEVIAQGEVDLSKAQSREISRLIRS
jgi:broad specificity phosphatase PhoE